MNIDTRFCPSLRTKLYPSEQEYFAMWGIDLMGTPAPAEKGHRAALWFPKIFNVFGEAPVFAVTAEYGDNFDIKSIGKWFGGIVLRESIIEAEDEIEVYQSEAQFQAPYLGRAITIVKNLIITHPIETE
jgi:hypothetical protein